MATLLMWLTLLGGMSQDETLDDSPRPVEQAVLLEEDVTSASSPFARDRAGFVPPWHDREAFPDSRLPISSGSGAR